MNFSQPSNGQKPELANSLTNSFRVSEVLVKDLSPADLVAFARSRPTFKIGSVLERDCKSIAAGALSEEELTSRNIKDLNLGKACKDLIRKLHRPFLKSIERVRKRDRNELERFKKIVKEISNDFYSNFHFVQLLLEQNLFLIRTYGDSFTKKFRKITNSGVSLIKDHLTGKECRALLRKLPYIASSVSLEQLELLKRAAKSEHYKDLVMGSKFAPNLAVSQLRLGQDASGLHHSTIVAVGSGLHLGKHLSDPGKQSFSNFEGTCPF